MDRLQLLETDAAAGAEDADDIRRHRLTQLRHRSEPCSAVRELKDRRLVQRIADSETRVRTRVLAPPPTRVPVPTIRRWNEGTSY